VNSETQIPANSRSLSAEELPRCLDHTLLGTDATRAQVLALCGEAQTYGFHAVCVNGRWVSTAADHLHGSGVKVASVVGFPLGSETTKAKVAQTKEAVRNGADEIDMVADLAAILEGDGRYLLRQVQAVLNVCHSMRPAVLLKVIVESATLTTEQKVFAYRAIEQVGADFIETGTGFHSAEGAKTEDVALVKETAPKCGVKAMGGIQTAEQAVALLRAGATRIGTSCGVQIVEELKGA